MLLSVALFVGSVFFPYFEPRFYSPEVSDLMTWSGFGAVLSWEVRAILWYGLLLAYGIVCIGLIYFKPWARECFLLVVTLLLLSAFLQGINILTEASTTYMQVMNLIDGFIIAMIYFSELRKEFEITHNKRMQLDAAEPRR